MCNYFNGDNVATNYHKRFLVVCAFHTLSFVIIMNRLVIVYNIW